VSSHCDNAALLWQFWCSAGRLVLLMATADDVDEQQAYSSGSSASSSGSS
jgi:hypothetical protein